MSDSRSFREYRNKSAVMEYLSDDDSVSSLVDDSDPFEEPPDDRSSAKHVSNSSVHTSSIKASFVSEASASSDEEVSASPNGKGDSDSEQEILVSPTPTASTDSDLEMMSSQRTQLPFASTPRTVAKPPSWAVDSPLPSSLVLSPPRRGSSGCNPDHSRSFRASSDSSGCMSPYSSKLAKDPSQQGKLRDRLMRKAISKEHQKREFDLANRPRDRIHRVEVEDEEVIESIGASPNARDETSSRGEDEVVEESVVGQTGDDDIIVLDSTSDDDDGKDTKAKDASVHGQQSTAKTSSITSTVECEIITLSSDDEQESKKCVENSRPPTLSPVQFIREVQVVEPSSKYKDHSTSSLEEKRSNAQKLLLKRLNLPDGGARLEKQILELGDELERRRTASAERPDHVDTEIHDITNAVQQLQVNPEQINRRQLNINDVLRDEYRPVARAIQEKAIQELHNALMSQPDQTQFAETPEGLTCPLKEHQKSGLTWLLWRESLAPRGGILADEMGLGKTLSMISLIVHAKAERKRRRKEGEDQEDKERRQRIKASGMIASNATLIVAPAALIYHWEAEIKQRCDEGLLKTVIYHQNRKNLGLESVARSDVVITTYTLLANEVESSGRGRSPHKDARKSSMLERIHWARIVLDEAHQIKNRKTKSSKAVCRLEADARWCVTGTPLHNNLWDLYSLIRFLKVDNFSEERYWKDYVTTSSKKSAERLNLLMKTFVLRREKSFISTMSNKPLVELPPKKSEEHFIEFEASERKAYDIMFQASRLHVQQLLTEEEQEGRPFRRWTKQKPSEAVPPARNPFLGAAASGANSNFQKMGCMLVLLLRLRQACLHFSLTKNALDMEAFKSLDSVEPLTIEQENELANLTVESVVEKEVLNDVCFIFKRKFLSAKIQMALQLLDSIIEGEERCVIVSQWTSFLALLEKHIRKRFPNVNCSSITGEVTPAERQSRVDEFNSPKGHLDVMLVSIKAGGVGLNLTGANHLILMDLHWNPALELQASDRVHRMGQTKHVFIHKFIMKDSIEERVLALQHKKMQLADSVLRGAVSKKAMNLTLGDLRFLFDLESKQP